MKVTSCDCFEKTGIDVSKCTYTDGLFTLGKEETMIFSDGTGCRRVRNELSYVKYCPFCGKKIEVQE